MGRISGSELASKLQVGYSSYMHEATLSTWLPPHECVRARRSFRILGCVAGRAGVGGSRISRTVVSSYTLLHAPMLGTHMSLRNASVRPQHGSCATACCFLFTRTTLARVARECTPLGSGTCPAAHLLLHP